MEPIIWNRYLPTGVSKADHYNEFEKLVNVAFSTVKGHRKIGYLVIGSGFIPVVYFCNTFMKDCIPTRGPFILGKLGDYPIVVTTTIDKNEFKLCAGDIDIIKELIKVFETNTKVDKALSETDVSLELKEKLICANRSQEHAVLDYIMAVINDDTIREGKAVYFNPDEVNN